MYLKLLLCLVGARVFLFYVLSSAPTEMDEPAWRSGLLAMCVSCRPRALRTAWYAAKSRSTQPVRAPTCTHFSVRLKRP